MCVDPLTCRLRSNKRIWVCSVCLEAIRLQAALQDGCYNTEVRDDVKKEMEELRGLLESWKCYVTLHGLAYVRNQRT